MKDYKRRHYFIDKGYQGRIILNIIMVCAAGMFLELGLFNYLSFRNMESLRWKMHIEADKVSEIISSYLLYSSIIALLFTITALYLFLRFVLRKTAGPIYRLNKDLQTAAEGDLSLNIWLRRDDDFRETAVELNKMLEAVRGDFRKLGAGFSEIDKTVNSLEYMLDKPEIASRKCRQLIEHLEPLKNIRQ